MTLSRIFPTVALLVATSSLHSAHAALVGHWDFNDGTGSTSAADAINSNDATLTNMDPNTDWVAGRIGGGLDFDGVNDEAIISGISQMDGAGEMTISIWVNAGPNGGFDGIFEHRSGGGGNLHGLLVSNSGEPEFRINSSAVTQGGGDVPDDGSWTHLAGTWDDGVFQRLYFNGALVAENDTSAPSGTLVSDDAWRFANDACCGGRNFDGVFDDAGLWNSALSTAEVGALFNLGDEDAINYDVSEVNQLLEAFESSTPQNHDRWHPLAPGRRRQHRRWRRSAVDRLHRRVLHQPRRRQRLYDVRSRAGCVEPVGLRTARAASPSATRNPPLPVVGHVFLDCRIAEEWEMAPSD